MKYGAFGQAIYVVPDYDPTSFEGLLRATLAFGRYGTDSRRVFGARDEVDSLRHFLGTALGWGGLPESEAFYLGIQPGLPVGKYSIEVPSEVPVGAFWSVSLYNADGFYEPNDLGGYVINSVSGERNADGSITIHLGGCDDGRANCLPIMEGWNYTVRMYQPGSEVLDGSWSFPAVKPAE